MKQWITLIVSLIGLAREVLRFVEAYKLEKTRSEKVQAFTKAIEKARVSHDTSDIEAMLSKLGSK